MLPGGHKNETLAIAASLIVLASAVWDAEVSFIVAFVVLILLSAYNSKAK
ncbi:MAG: hypothetical protein HY516_05205 [Candidatus Aenigmarchaeota archaeon]|nr:hypothetical protein [Candidatus Aenigmarchaeota archaeon]